MPQYMLALYDDPSGWKKLSPEEMQKAVEKYMAWGKKPYVIRGNASAPILGGSCEPPTANPGQPTAHTVRPKRRWAAST